MDLINEYNNRHFQAYACTLNASRKKNLTVTEFEKLFKEFANDKNYYAANFMDTIKELNKSFTEVNSDGIVKPAYEGKIDFPTSELDEIYIKSILQSEYAGLFADTEFSEKLEICISDAKYYDYSKMFYSRKNAAKKNISSEFIEKFRMIRTAIREKCFLKFSNVTRTGDVYKNQKAFPLKIEFSVLTEKFYVSMWSYENNRPFKCVLSSLTDIEIAEKNEDFDYAKLIGHMQDKRSAEPIEMIVSGKYKNNAIERAKFVFSVYEHENKVNQDDTYTIKIWYYSYDEMEIINNIMSFGPSLKVISPNTIVEKIKEKLNMR